MPESSTTPGGNTTPTIERLVSSSAMEYISPTTSRRRHIPLPSVSSVISADIPEQDNAADRKQRRHSRVMELHRQLQSPGTPTERRRSLPLSNLNNAQITDHYTSCIKLSTENKINSKNAFGLHLIDYMSELLKSKTGEMTNFQVASCTLDASAKIYAGRVDAIHAETYKMLGGLGHGDRQNKDGEAGGDGDNAEDDESNGNRKKRKRVRKSNTVETNLKSINVNKFDLGFEVDPLFQKTSASFDEGGTFGLLLNHLRCQDDSCELLLDSNIQITGMEMLQDEDNEKAEGMIDLTEIKDIYGGKNMDDLQICPHFVDFEFTNWKQEADETSTFKEIMSKMAHSDHAFDMNAVPEPIDMPEPINETMGMDHFGGGDMSDDDIGADGLGDATVFMSDGQAARMISSRSACSAVSSGSAGELCLQLSIQPSEYSYFDPAVMDMWAGPSHWKVKSQPKDEKKAKSKKVLFHIDFSEEIDFEKNFCETKVATTLSKGTLTKYSNNVTTLPDDIHYDPENLFRLFTKPSFTVKRLYSSSEVTVDDGIGSYDYNNDNDCVNFCPAADNGDDDDDIGNDFSAVASDMTHASLGSHDSACFVNESIFDVTTFQGDKLVAQPRKVNKINITYAKTAKRIDVKKLKAHMWNYLTILGENDKENQGENETKKQADGVFGTQSFNEMYESLPNKISSTMNKNLSIPIAFVCLLHLANEKCLKVDGLVNMDDLTITQDI